MTMTTLPTLRLSLVALAAASFLSACGGGGTDLATPAASQMRVVVPVAKAAAATTTTTTTHTIVVRARADLYAGVGAIMQVSVGGVVIATQEVDATSATDYTFTTTQDVAGAAIDIAFTNDASSATQDRNLYITSVTVDSATVTAASGTVDTGAGQKLGDGSAIIWSNGALHLTAPAATGGDGTTNTIVVNARADLYAGVGAIMQVSVGGVVIGTQTVSSTSLAAYTFTTTQPVAGAAIDIAFTNDASSTTQDRNLYVGSVVVNSATVAATSGMVDTGAGGLVGDGSVIIWSNGALHLTGPAATSGDGSTNTIVVNARADLYAGVGAIMQVSVGGVVIGTQTVSSTSLAAYTFTTTRAVAGAAIDIAFTNDASSATQDRNLYVRTVVVNGVAVASSSATLDAGTGAQQGDTKLIWSDGAMHLTGPTGTGGTTTTTTTGTGANALVVNAWADLLDGVGADMQVSVNGTIIGTLRVGSAVPADYTFLTDLNLNGADVSIAFTNDATSATQDRNLYVASVTANGSTVAATTAIQDAGTGQAQDGDRIIWSDGAIQLTLPGLADGGTVKPAGFAGAHVVHLTATGDDLLEVFVNGTSIGTNRVNGTLPTELMYVSPAAIQPGDVIQVKRATDATITTPQSAVTAVQVATVSTSTTGTGTVAAGTALAWTVPATAILQTSDQPAATRLAALRMGYLLVPLTRALGFTAYPNACAGGGTVTATSTASTLAATVRADWLSTMADSLAVPKFEGFDATDYTELDFTASACANPYYPLVANQAAGTLVASAYPAALLATTTWSGATSTLAVASSPAAATASGSKFGVLGLKQFSAATFTSVANPSGPDGDGTQSLLITGQVPVLEGEDLNSTARQAVNLGQDLASLQVEDVPGANTVNLTGGYLAATTVNTATASAITTQETVAMDAVSFITADGQSCVVNGRVSRGFTYAPASGTATAYTPNRVVDIAVTCDGLLMGTVSNGTAGITLNVDGTATPLVAPAAS